MIIIKMFDIILVIAVFLLFMQNISYLNNIEIKKINNTITIDESIIINIQKTLDIISKDLKELKSK
jgi:cell division protein FtsL